MELSFTCSCADDDVSSPHRWKGRIQILDPDSGEMDVSARGSLFHIICGRYRDGNYICIPNIDIGASMADFGDTFWNREHLRNCYPDLSKVDIISITQALAVAQDYLNI